MQVADRDRSLDTLLDLDGVVIVVDEAAGHWVRFRVGRVEPTPERLHGLDYSLTLHGEDGSRLVGFDNAHPVRRSRGPGGQMAETRDHRHRHRTVRPYDYLDAATLLADFWAEVDSVLRERGVL